MCQDQIIEVKKSEKIGSFGIKELLEDKNIDWSFIKEKFRTDRTQFEELLFKIHFKRKRLLPTEKRSRLLNFLTIGYLSTDDIRYFNEFLWFYRENNFDKPLLKVCIEKFDLNLDDEGHHRLLDQFNSFPIDAKGKDTNSFDCKRDSPFRVCLIGFPPFFGTIIKKLKKEGFHVEQFYLPNHFESRIIRLMKFWIPIKVLSLLSGNYYSYRTLKFDHKDERIGQILREGHFDIGFHKLNTIINNNIYSAFRLGLLNDHWGYLPLLRGRSTISYSLLLNIPVIPTIHLINEGIDLGPIIGYFHCDYSKARSVKEIRRILRKTMPERAITAIKLALSEDFVCKENKKELGATFYEIHPWLNNHIASRIWNKMLAV